MAEEEEGKNASPLDFFPGEGSYSFESFPRQLPQFGSEFPSADYVRQDSGLFDGLRRPDAFGFPTELQMQGLTAPPPELLSQPEAADVVQGSSENSTSNRRATQTPSLAQVKNRKAQKRFRERQKAKMANLSEEVEALRQRVADLSVENRDLENSNMLLNKVIKMRDRQMVSLRLPQLLNCPEGETLSMERSLTVAKHLSTNFPASKFTNIDQACMKGIWKEYVETLSGLLINHEADPDDPDIVEKIHLAVGELGEICMNCATLCPTSMCSLVATGDTAFSLPVDSDEVQSFWKNVLTSLQLTEEQELLVLEQRHRFLQHLETIWKKRTLLSNRLQSLVTSKGDVFKSNLDSCRSGSGVRVVFEELRETCLIDGQYHTDFIASFFQLVLKDLQTARVFVESFPYYPDVLQISNLVYKKHQEMRQEAVSRSTASEPAAFHRE